MQNLPITPAQNISTYATMTEEDINIYWVEHKRKPYDSELQHTELNTIKQ